LARDYFERASNIDPQNTEAMVGLAYARMRASVYGWSTTADFPAQMDLLTKATAIDPSYAFAYYAKSMVLTNTKQLSEALEAAQRVVALDPNAAYGYFAMALSEAWLGRCEQSNRPRGTQLCVGHPLHGRKYIGPTSSILLSRV
jgi:tetratricopeptide (TPR) repeat protein